MSNGIGRLRTLGIAAQPTFGTAAASATYVMPLTNTPLIQPVVTKLKNNAALGSAYMNNEIENGYRYAEVPIEVKVDEDQAPLFFKQRFTIASVTASGESAVYSHTGTYTNTTNTWYTLFLQDDQRQDYVMKDVLLGNLDWTLDGEFVRLSATAQGAIPTATNVTNTVTQPKEFVGRMATFKVNDDGQTTTATNALSISANLAFGTNSEETRFSLGNQDLAVHQLTADEFTFEVSGLQVDRTNYDDYISNQARQFEIVIQNTDRYVTGSVASTRPKIELSVPYAKVTEYTDDAELDDLVKESYTLEALDKVGEANAPMTFTIVNAVASY